MAAFIVLLDIPLVEVEQELEDCGFTSTRTAGNHTHLLRECGFDRFNLFGRQLKTEFDLCLSYALLQFTWGKLSPLIQRCLQEVNEAFGYCTLIVIIDSAVYGFCHTVDVVNHNVPVELHDLQLHIHLFVWHFFLWKGSAIEPFQCFGNQILLFKEQMAGRIRLFQHIVDSCLDAQRRVQRCSELGCNGICCSKSKPVNRCEFEGLGLDHFHCVYWECLLDFLDLTKTHIVLREKQNQFLQIPR